MNQHTTGPGIKLSVHMPAYNHEAYIAQAIESVLMQRVDFDYEIVIGEDCSTDKTRLIVVDYGKRFPGRIRPLLHERNLGIYENDQAIVRECRGKYIAWLESDDWWTSPDKLQKQVDFLDRHIDYSACFHRAECVGASQPAMWRPGPPENKPYYTVDDLLENGHFIPSCTAVFRSDLVRTPAPWTKSTPFLERTYFVRFGLSGKIGYIDEQMAAFRFHSQGIYGKATNVENVASAINTHRLLGAHFSLKQRSSYRIGLARMYRRLSSEYLDEGRPIRAAAAGCRALLLARR
jgi:glycosyltransferase involved in cell wall biosynthesis